MHTGIEPNNSSVSKRSKRSSIYTIKSAILLMTDGNNSDV